MVLVFHRNKKLVLSRKNGSKNMETEEYQTRIGLLGDIAEEANSIAQVLKLLERILRVTQHTLGASITTLFLNEEHNTQIHSPFTISKDEELARYEATPIESEIAGPVAKDITPVFINDIAADLRFNPEDKDPSDLAIRSAIAAPILRGKSVIGVIIAANKDDGGDFTERDFEVLKGFASTEALVLLVSMEVIAVENVNSLTLDQALPEGNRNILHELATAMDVKDTYAYDHSRHVKEYALLAAHSLSLPPSELQSIELGALLHDVGKIGIDQDILSKPGPLSDEEWKVIREHPQKGVNILENIPNLKEVMDIVLYHHERYDGKGYPKKLKGEEIPFNARLVAVADAFDAMTNEHSYRPNISIDEAMKELVECTGTQFCPKSVEAFISAFKKRDAQPSIKEDDTEITTEVVKKVKHQKIKAKKEDKEARKEAKEVKKPAKERKATSANNIDAEVPEGNIRLVVPIAINTEEVKRFSNELEKIEGVTVLMLSHSEEEGHIFLLSLEKAIPLMRYIKEMPRVEGIERKGKNISVILSDEFS